MEVEVEVEEGAGAGVGLALPRTSTSKLLHLHWALRTSTFFRVLARIAPCAPGSVHLQAPAAPRSHVAALTSHVLSRGSSHVSRALTWQHVPRALTWVCGFLAIASRRVTFVDASPSYSLGPKSITSSHPINYQTDFHSLCKTM